MVLAVSDRVCAGAPAVPQLKPLTGVCDASVGEKGKTVGSAVDARLRGHPFRMVCALLLQLRRLVDSQVECERDTMVSSLADQERPIELTASQPVGECPRLPEHLVRKPAQIDAESPLHFWDMKVCARTPCPALTFLVGGGIAHAHLLACWP